MPCPLLQVSLVNNQVFRSQVIRSFSVLTHASNLESIRVDDKVNGIKPFTSIPGPKGVPFIGNIWRYFPILGKECYA